MSCLSLFISPPSGGMVRAAKAEKRMQERLRQDGIEVPSGGEKQLSPAEERALQAEKRAAWRKARCVSSSTINLF